MLLDTGCTGDAGHTSGSRLIDGELLLPHDERLVEVIHGAASTS